MHTPIGERHLEESSRHARNLGCLTESQQKGGRNKTRRKTSSKLSVGIMRWIQVLCFMTFYVGLKQISAYEVLADVDDAQDSLYLTDILPDTIQTENSMSETDHRHSYPVHEAKQQTEDTIQLSNSLVRLIHVLNMIKAREGGGRGVSPKPSLKRVTSKRGPASIVSSAESDSSLCIWKVCPPRPWRRRRHQK